MSSAVPNLWDDEESVEEGGLSIQDLYLLEKGRREELELQIAKLLKEIQILKDTNLELLSKLEGSSIRGDEVNTIADKSDQIEIHPHVASESTDKWTMLAKEEKNRKKLSRMRNLTGRNSKRGVKSILKQVDELSAGLDCTSAPDYSLSNSEISPRIATSTKLWDESDTGSDADIAVGRNSSAETTNGAPQGSVQSKSVLECDSSDSDNEFTDPRLPSTSTTVPSINSVPATTVDSEWLKLAAEEKARKQKARQRMIRRGASNNARGVGKSVSSPKGDAIVAAVTTRHPNDGNKHSERRNSRTSTNTATGGGLARGDNNFTWDSTSDNDSQDEDSEDWDTIDSTQRSRNLEVNGGMPASASSASLESTVTNRSCDSNGTSMEEQVERDVVRWAQGSNIVRLLRTLHVVYHGELADLGALWTPHCVVLPTPSDVRKAYLKAVRYCHPDKHAGSDNRRVAIEAACVFAALSDAYNLYRSEYQ